MSYLSTSDNFGKTVNQGIFIITDANFAREKVVYQPEFRKQDLTKGKYFRIYENGSEVLEQGAMYEARSYNYQISYYYQYGGDEPKQKYENIITNDWNNFYYTLMGFRHHEDNTLGYCWHNIEFTSVSELTWGFDEEDMEVGHIDAEVSFWRTNEFENLVIALGGGGL